MRLLSSVLGLFAASAFSGGGQDGGLIARRYQRMRPITNKNIGRDWLKGRSRYVPHQGKQECARSLRQWAKIEARRAGQ